MQCTRLSVTSMLVVLGLLVAGMTVTAWGWDGNATTDLDMNQHDILDADDVCVGTCGSPPFGLVVSDTVSETARSSDNARMGVASGTPRLIFEDNGYTQHEIDAWSGEMRFFRPGSVDMIIKSDGVMGIGQRLGIGTWSPINKLDVRGAVAIGNSYGGSETAPNQGLIVEGQVGIGTDDPSEKLHVEGNVAIDYDADNSYSLYFNAANSQSARLFIEDDLPQQGLHFQTNGGSAMMITGDRKVGVGGVPSEKFEVVDGNVKCDELKLGTYMAIREASGPTRAEVVGNFGVTVDTYLEGQLNVSGDATVLGKVIADSVRVEKVYLANNWSIEAPDYVFQPDYTLRSLDEVEKFVREEEHLPDVPSGTQMEQTGLDVGQMNMVLLKKVEELTLYLIDQQKQISALKAQIAQR